MNKKEYERRMVFAREEAVKAWRGGEIISDLAEEFAKILVYHMYEPHLGCATTRELLKVIEMRSNLDYTTMDEPEEPNGEEEISEEIGDVWKMD